MKGKRFKLNVGDVFTISLSESEIGFGQCVTPHKKTSGGFVIAVFPVKMNKNQIVQMEEVAKYQPVFLGYTFDAKLYHKDWVIIDNYTLNIVELKLPYNRLGTPPDEIYLTDVEGKRVAEISEDVFNDLEYKTEIAPVRYENALKAYFGLQEWKVDYDKLLYAQTLKSNEVAKRVLSNA